MDNSIYSNNTLIALYQYLTGACDTGVAGVWSTEVSGAEPDAETEAESGPKLDRKVKRETECHSVMFIAGR